MRPIKAIIFSVSIGSGHDLVAKAFQENLLEEIPGSEVKIVDTFQYINSVLHKVVVGSYMETLKFTPKVWGYLYDQAEDGERLVDLGQLFSKVLSPRLEQLLKDFCPDVIIATHAFPTGIIAVLKEKMQSNIPLAAAVTDFHVHSYWIHQGVDLYFIPAIDLAYPLLRSGIAEEKIKAIGIPIRRQFTFSHDKIKAKAELGILSEAPTVLVMGGGLGLGRIEVIVREVLSEDYFQVMVVAGQNKRLQEALNAINHPKLKVFGFIENMAQVMVATDIVISKPGGVTTAEILAMQVPLVIYSSLPGQEDRNTEYLLNKGVAIKVRKLDMLYPGLLSLWQNPLRLKHMKEMAQQLGSPHSSRLAWESIYPLIK